MPPTANTADDPPQSSNSSASGKLLLIGILSVAIVAAASSWWFRYNATHRTAAFWGGDAAALIRDAPEVKLHVTTIGAVGDLANNPDASPVSSDFDVSHARGLTHLRNALLEDFNFAWSDLHDWPPINADDFHDWRWILEFRDPRTGKFAATQFTQDCSLAARVMSSKERGSVKPIAIRTDPAMAKALREMFAEFTKMATPPTGDTPSAVRPSDAPQ
jgi:hypothetical protein